MLGRSFRAFFKTHHAVKTITQTVNTPRAVRCLSTLYSTFSRDYIYKSTNKRHEFSFQNLVWINELTSSILTGCGWALSHHRDFALFLSFCCYMPRVLVFHMGRALVIRWGFLTKTVWNDTLVRPYRFTLKSVCHLLLSRVKFINIEMARSSLLT